MDWDARIDIDPREDMGTALRTHFDAKLAQAGMEPSVIREQPALIEAVIAVAVALHKPGTAAVVSCSGRTGWITVRVEAEPT